MKQAIVIRTDLKMGRGKIAAQCSHASIMAYERANEEDREQWDEEGSKKIVLKVSSKKEILDIFTIAKAEKLPCSLIKDAGLTQIGKGEITAVGIGPAPDEDVDKITGKLKLL